jgi:hypothetical protein
MPGMKVTLSAAMRARDVSRPRSEDEEAAERAEVLRAAGGNAPRRGNGTDSAPAPGGRPREDAGTRAAPAVRKSTGSGGRSRRKRR